MLRALVDACPDRKADVDALGRAQSNAVRRTALLGLASCGRTVERYHIQLGAVHFAANDFAGAERSYRRALALRVTEAGQVGLLTALVRQSDRSPRQRAIQLGFPGWQPYFFGGIAFAVGDGADRSKAIGWLREAKKRGAPAAVDGLLGKLEPRE